MGNRLVVIFALCGCVGGDDTTTFENAGSVCLRSTATGSVKVVVTFPTCLSSSCDRVTMSACQIVEKDGTIRVGSRAQVQHEGGACTDDCGSLTALCESAPIAGGTYTVTYGSNTATITLPTSGQMVFSDGSGLASCPDG
jgi:hypothetical protein